MLCRLIKAQMQQWPSVVSRQHFIEIICLPLVQTAAQRNEGARDELLSAKLLPPTTGVQMQDTSVSRCAQSVGTLGSAAMHIVE